MMKKVATFVGIFMILLTGGFSNVWAVSESQTSETSQVNPKEIQKALTEAGFYKGNIDGVIGNKTKAAIRSFQEANGLKVDGVCGPKTWEKLKAYLEEAKEIDEAQTETQEATESLDDSSAPTLDESDYSYSEYDLDTTEDTNEDLKQKLVS